MKDDTERLTVETFVRLETFMNDLTGSSFHIDRGLAILESLNIGLGVLETDGTLRYLNRPAERFLQETHCLMRHPEGHLMPCQHHDQFRQLLRQMSTAPHAGIEHVLLSSAKGRRYPILMKTDDSSGQREIILIFPQRQEAPRPEPSLLMAWYGLTHAEARLLSRLAGGLCLKETALVCGITIGTARIHLKHILHKTGFHRQTDLLIELRSNFRN